MKTAGKFLIPFLLGAVVAIVAMFAISGNGLFQSGKVSLTSATIKASFNEIAELASEEYVFSDMGKYSQDDMSLVGDLKIPFTGKSFILSYDGKVKAGIRDMSAVDVVVDDVTKTIEVRAPKVEILDVYIDPSTAQTLDETFNPLNQISTEDVMMLLASETERAQQEALANGMLEKAKDHSEEVLTKFLSFTLTGTQNEGYKIKVTWV